MAALLRIGPWNYFEFGPVIRRLRLKDFISRAPVPLVLCGAEAFMQL